MEEEAKITAVQEGSTRKLGEGLKIESLHVSFLVVPDARYQGQVKKAAFKAPAWIRDLEPSAPSEGYLMEDGHFTVELMRDDRLKPGLSVTIQVTEC